jgi:hypothetical protein
MDDYQRVNYLRGLAHECRMLAAMTNSPEGRQRWLDSARDHERQAEHLKP